MVFGRGGLAALVIALAVAGCVSQRYFLPLQDNPARGSAVACARRWLEIVTSLVTLHGIETDEGHLDLSLRAVPAGVGHAMRTLHERFVAPRLARAQTRLRGLLPGAR